MVTGGKRVNEAFAKAVAAISDSHSDTSNVLATRHCKKDKSVADNGFKLVDVMCGAV
jgi:SHS2 domain-containing protein